MSAIALACLKHLVTLASGWGANKKLFVLIYHRVLDAPDFMRPGEVDKQVFAWQMALLAKYFNVLPVSEALEKLATHTLPARAVCITFDDGYADNLLNAAPILKQHQLPALFFIASGYLDGGRMWNDSIIEAVRRMGKAELDLSGMGLGCYPIVTPEQKQLAANDIINALKHAEPGHRLQISERIAAMADTVPDNLMLTTEQLKALQRQGMEIGGHTVSHPILAKLAEKTVAQEVRDNKIALEQLVNTPIRYFAYPNGKPGADYLPEQVAIIKDTGYTAAFSTQWGVVDAYSDRWQLPRFTPWDKSPFRFMLRMAAVYFKAP